MPSISASSAVNLLADELPAEIWLTIADRLDCEDQARLRAVSRSMHAVVEEIGARQLSALVREHDGFVPAACCRSAFGRAQQWRAHRPSLSPAPELPLGWLADAHLVRRRWAWGADRPRWRHEVVRRPRRSAGPLGLGGLARRLVRGLLGDGRAALPPQMPPRCPRERAFARCERHLRPLAPPPSGAVSIPLHLSRWGPEQVGRPLLAHHPHEPLLDDSWHVAARLRGLCWEPARAYVLAIIEAPGESVPGGEASAGTTCTFGVFDARYPLAREALEERLVGAGSNLCIDSERIDACPTRGALQVSDERIEVLLAADDGNAIDRFTLAMAPLHQDLAPEQLNYRQLRPEPPLGAALWGVVEGPGAGDPGALQVAR